MNRVILVEDHERLAKLISSQLESKGIAVDTFHRMEHVLSAIQQIPYRMIILDRRLPEGDGLNLLRKMRSLGVGLPCLILTARDAVHDRIEGLDSGADDYLTKPFEMDEMIARVRALLRRPLESMEAEPSYGDVQIKPSSSSMRCGEEEITLAPAELQIALLLVRKAPSIVRHSTLEAAGWGLSEAVTPNALDVALYRIRKKLSAIGSNVRIKNMRSLGYALTEI